MGGRLPLLSSLSLPMFASFSLSSPPEASYPPVKSPIAWLWWSSLTKPATKPASRVTSPGESPTSLPLPELPPRPCGLPIEAPERALPASLSSLVPWLLEQGSRQALPRLPWPPEQNKLLGLRRLRDLGLLPRLPSRSRSSDLQADELPRPLEHSADGRPSVFLGPEYSSRRTPDRASFSVPWPPSELPTEHLHRPRASSPGALASLRPPSGLLPSTSRASSPGLDRLPSLPAPSLFPSQVVSRPLEFSPSTGCLLLLSVHDLPLPSIFPGRVDSRCRASFPGRASLLAPCSPSSMHGSRVNAHRPPSTNALADPSQHVSALSRIPQLGPLDHGYSILCSSRT